MLNTGTIYGINGPVIYLKGNTGFRMSEMVYVGEQKLVGEVIALDKDMTTVQVYEETTGLRPGEEVVASGNAVSVTLAPGILNNIFDGIERPLERIAESSGGAFITRGVSVDSLDRQKKWQTHITVEKGQYLHGGDIIAEVPETHAIVHKCMVPPDVEGTVIDTVPDSTGPSVCLGRHITVSRHLCRLSQDSVSLTLCFPLPKAVRPLSPAVSEQERP